MGGQRVDQHVNPERGMMKQGGERTASYDTRRKPRTVGGTTWAGRRSVENTDVLLGRATSVEPWGGRDMGGRGDGRKWGAVMFL